MGTWRPPIAGALRCDVRALASLFSGYQSATSLEQAGKLVAPAEALELADAICASPTAPSMPDMF